MRFRVEFELKGAIEISAPNREYLDDIFHDKNIKHLISEIDETNITSVEVVENDEHDPELYRD